MLETYQKGCRYHGAQRIHLPSNNRFENIFISIILLVFITPVQFFNYDDQLSFDLNFVTFLLFIDINSFYYRYKFCIKKRSKQNKELKINVFKPLFLACSACSFSSFSLLIFAFFFLILFRFCFFVFFFFLLFTWDVQEEITCYVYFSFFILHAGIKSLLIKIANE